MGVIDNVYGRFPVQTVGEIDYVAGGNIYTKVEVKDVLVGSESDLSL